MFDIQLNKQIIHFLSSIKNTENDVEISGILSQNFISIDTLKELYQLNHDKSSVKPLKELLTPLKFKFKNKKQPGSEYSKEFKKQLEFLKLKSEEEAYQDMIEKSNLRSKTYGDDYISPAQMNKQIKEQITTVFNIIVSVLSVIAAIWYWTKSSMVVSPELRVLLCLFFGILVLVAEIVVYNSYLNKIDDARIKEKSIKEERKVIKKVVL